MITAFGFPPSTLAVEFCYSETRACLYHRVNPRRLDRLTRMISWPLPLAPPGSSNHDQRRHTLAREIPLHQKGGSRFRVNRGKSFITYNSHHKSWAQRGRTSPAPQAPASGQKTRRGIEGEDPAAAVSRGSFFLLPVWRGPTAQSHFLIRNSTCSYTWASFDSEFRRFEHRTFEVESLRRTGQL